MSCPVCKDSHDETLSLLWQAEISRIPSSDIAGELAYVERELAIEPLPERRGPLLHRKGWLLKEQTRRKISPLRSQSFLDRIQRAKQGCDLEGLIDLNISRMRGDKTWYHCDAHGTDSDASFVLYGSLGRWWCYGCNSGGDVIDWLIARRNLSFMDALKALETYRGIQHVPQKGGGVAV